MVDFLMSKIACMLDYMVLRETLSIFPSLYVTDSHWSRFAESMRNGLISFTIRRNNSCMYLSDLLEFS
jgi:hypothetical protein